MSSRSAVQIAYRLRVPPLLVGFTIVAIGTSLPELAVAIEAVAQNEPDIAVGGVLGSNVANVMLVLGTACMLGSGDEAGAELTRFRGCYLGYCPSNRLRLLRLNTS